MQAQYQQEGVGQVEISGTVSSLSWHRQMGRLKHWWKDRRYGRSGLGIQSYSGEYRLEETSEGATEGDGEGSDEDGRGKVQG